MVSPSAALTMTHIRSQAHKQYSACMATHMRALILFYAPLSRTEDVLLLLLLNIFITNFTLSSIFDLSLLQAVDLTSFGAGSATWILLLRFALFGVSSVVR